nr:CD209 antigen-like protein D [Cherax quadricarinatus]
MIYKLEVRPYIADCRCSGGEEESKRRMALSCERPFVFLHGHCILVESQKTGNWNEMKTFCNHKGTEMVKVDSENFMYYLVKYLHGNGLAVVDYWVGGSDQDNEGTFFWPDGTRVKMGTPFWGDGPDDHIQEPDGGAGQNCIGMWKDDHYFLFDYNCNDRIGVICEKV